MKKQPVQSIGDVIRSYLKESNLEAKIIEEELICIFPRIIGEHFASFCSNLFVKDHTLYVSCSSSVLRNELMMSRQMLMRNLNRELGGEFITQIIFR